MTFPDFCRQHGIIPPESFTPGRWQRSATETAPKKKTANVKLCEDNRTGFAIDFAAMTEAAVWRESNSRTAKRDLGAENAERSARLALRENEEAEGMARAMAAWKKAKEFRNADLDYFRAKNLTMLGCKGLRALNSHLLIPMWRDGRIVSIQSIAPDGSKLFTAGAPTKGAVFWIDRPLAPVTLICEGFATGLTLAESVPLAKVCVTFSASNMIEVATRLDWHGMTTIAGDNDHAKPCPWCLKNGEHLQNPPNAPRPEQCRCNAGWTAALAVAKIIGCGVAIPPAAEGVTDWNDAFCAALSKKEESQEFQKWKPSPFSLRKEACALIYASVMSASRMV